MSDKQRALTMLANITEAIESQSSERLAPWIIERLEAIDEYFNAPADNES